MMPVKCRPVEMGFKNLGLNLKSPNFWFLGFLEQHKIQILNSHS